MESSKEDRYLISRDFQLALALKLIFIIWLTSVLVCLILYLLIGAPLGESYSQAIHTLRNKHNLILRIIIFSSLGQVMVFALVAILVLLFASHKIAGPLYRLERILKEMAQGDLNYMPISLRKKDQIKSVADALNDMGSYLRERLRLIRTYLVDIEGLSQELNTIPQKEKARLLTKELKERIDKIAALLSELKT